MERQRKGEGGGTERVRKRPVQKEAKGKAGDKEREAAMEAPEGG